ncbi:MAG: hypothetical protein KKH91_04440, partial [Elusimicrobia bacterium]|nr:hypothetical protein [Elusimicrobiota bacterium]
KSKKETQRIISDWAEENIDNLPKTVISGDKTIKSTNYELQKTFEYFVKKNLIPFYPEDRSIGRVRESIYRFFENEFKMKYEEVQNEIIKIALSDKNVQHFVNVIDLSKEEYKNEVIKRQSEIEYQKDWNIPESISYTSDYVEQKGKKSILQPFYTDGKWKPENAFIEYLNKSEKIEWWFKNGDRDATFFAVPYNDSGDKPFYVDFIVKFKNGQIGLFDTKSGMTLKIAGPKIDGLSEYINNENKKGNKLFGGIVTNTDSKDFKGRWVYFDKQSKELKNDDFSNWATLEM